jgi:beta-lactam-binding protein with PASTA domain
MRWALALVLMLCGACTIGSTHPPQPPALPPSPSLVPTLVDHTEGQAKATVRAKGYKPKRQHDWSKEKKGTVIQQSPKPGTELAPGATVTYVVSDGLPVVPRWITGGIFGPVPTSGNAATQTLAKLDLRRGDVVPAVSTKLWASPGQVIASMPKSGSHVRPGTVVNLFVVQPPPCTPGYSACLPPHFALHSWVDYDCAGGTGDGPYYAPYTRVWGDDPYQLDDDGDGIGCE